MKKIEAGWQANSYHNQKKIEQLKNSLIHKIRLNVEVPLPVHKKLKEKCAIQGKKISDVINEMILNFIEK